MEISFGGSLFRPPLLGYDAEQNLGIIFPAVYGVGRIIFLWRESCGATRCGMSDQIMRENIFVIAQTFANAKGLSLTTVSKKIHGNGEFFARFMAGEISTGIDTYFTMIDKFRAEWPRGTEWPRTAEIPAPRRKEHRKSARPIKRGDSGRFLGKNVDGAARR